MVQALRFQSPKGGISVLARFDYIICSGNSSLFVGHDDSDKIYTRLDD
jgi:hypothetical protein